MSKLSEKAYTGPQKVATFGTATMMDHAWNTAQAWGAAARQQQTLARHQAAWTLVLVALAAALAAVVGAIGGSSTTATGGTPAAGTLPLRWTTVASVIAGLLATVGALWGRYVQQGSAEHKWIAARAAAQFIQSECHRYASAVTPYDELPASSSRLFSERVSIASQAARKQGALPIHAAPSPERPSPPDGMNADWYRQYRLLRQQEFYNNSAKRHTNVANRLRRIAFAFGVVAAILGFAGAVDGMAFIAAGVGAFTTIAGGVAAFSSVDRNTQVATRYSEMAEALESLLGQHRAGLLTDAELVDHGETLLTAEYAAWQQLILKRQAVSG